MSDYIPSADAQFDEWTARFAAYCAANQVALGLKVVQVNKLTAANTTWHTAYTDHQTAQTTARAKSQAKSDRREETEEVIRQTARIIQANPDVTDEQRRAAGLVVAGASAAPGASGGGVEAPLLLLCDFSQRGRCTIHFGINPSNEHANAKPRGVRGVKIWYATVSAGAPGNAIPESAWQWLADDTNSPYLHVVGGSQTVTLVYRAQYFDSQMRLGPLCDPVIVTITL